MKSRTALAVFFVLLALVVSALSALPGAHAQTTAGATLTIGGHVSQPLALSADDLKQMPRKTLSVLNPHEKKNEVYEGVLVEELLKRAGVPQGEKLRGAALATYLIFEADDGYRAVFSIAELDSGITDSEVIVADTLDGTALPAKIGPFRLVAPKEKRPAHWVRMLKSITVVRAANP